tara:strand:- start:10162 stop:13512 length:3351 start_codon:yes stop_codon:yes gene_type:complete
MADGFSIESLIKSLSGYGSGSGDLATLSITGAQEQVKPIIDYGEFSRHIFFGDALRRFRVSLRRIEQEYPIGSSAEPAIASLCAENIYRVDKFKKQSNDFELWFLNELTKNQAGTAGSITAAANNDAGEPVRLPWIVRNSTNTITGSQTAAVDSISARAENFEKENREQIDQTAGTGVEIFSTSTGSERRVITFPATGERVITRSQKLSNMLPTILFAGDNDDVLENTLAAMGDMIDDLKLFIEYVPYVKRISYEDNNRTPNKFLPVIAREYGIELFESAAANISNQNFTTTTGDITNKEITYKLWNRIMNNAMYLLKTKGTRETIEAIGRIYGVDHNFLKTNEYSLFNGPTQVREIEEVDVPVLFSTGDVFVQTTSHAVTGSANAFDFAGGQNFTVQMRVSATAGAAVGATGHVLFRHPLYEIDMNGSGQVAIRSTLTASMSAITDLNSVSSYIHTKDNFVNVAASRSGNGLNVFAFVLSGSPSGGNDIVVMNSGSTTHAHVALANFNSSGGVAGIEALPPMFASYFPGSGSFTGYVHEVRAWNLALANEDMMEHTRNFESISFINSTASPRNATYSSLSAHFKLRENAIFAGDYNYIVDSTTAGNSAVPVSFESVGTDSRYRIFPNHKKINTFYPAGLAADNDRIRQTDSGTDQKDIGYVSLSLNPINAVNRQIKNHIQNINVYDLMGTAEDHRMGRYHGPMPEKWHEISAQWGLSVSASMHASGSVNNRFKSGGGLGGTAITGVSGSTVGVTDLNTFISAMDNFNDVLGGLFSFVKQFIPAKTNILAEGIYIESHMLERSKIKRRFGHRETGVFVNAGALTADGNILSDDEGSTPYNSTPSIIEHSISSMPINNRFNAWDLEYQDVASGNTDALIASAGTTARFQAFQYTDNNVQLTIDNSITSSRNVPNLVKHSSRNAPRFLPTRVGRFLPIRITPAAPALSELDITLDQLLISPTAATTSSNGFISGRVRMLAGGSIFKTSSPALRFEFPTSGDGTNLFIATVGDINAGQGREIKDKDTIITTPLEIEETQFKLLLHDVVTSLSAINGARGITNTHVDDSISGSVGIVPITVVNLFNNNSYVFRVGINSDTNRETDLIAQITRQGVDKIQS